MPIEQLKAKEPARNTSGYMAKLQEQLTALLVTLRPAAEDAVVSEVVLKLKAIVYESYKAGKRTSETRG